MLAFPRSDRYCKRRRFSNNGLTANPPGHDRPHAGSAARVSATIGRVAVSRRIRSVGIAVMSGLSRSGSRGAFPRSAWRWLVIAGALRLAFDGFTVNGDDAPAIAFCEKAIRPLFVAKCQSCHGEQKAKAGLRLTDRESLMTGGESGPAIVAAVPNESLLIRAVRYLDEPKMPPKHKLSEGEIAALERWVASGAPWPSSTAGTARPSDRATANTSWWAF